MCVWACARVWARGLQIENTLILQEYIDIFSQTKISFNRKCQNNYNIDYM